MLALVSIVGVVGLCVGSFLNVVIHRVPEGRSVVRPGSACPACGSRVRAYDNIPVVSWIVLRGRCRDCDASISIRYVLVEAAVGVAFAAIAVVQIPLLVSAPSAIRATSASLEFVALLYFAAVSIALALIDLETHRLPNAIVGPSYGVLAVLLGLAALTGGTIEQAAVSAAGAGILFGAYFLLALIAPQGMGMGDVKLAGVIGLVLGYVGWSALAVGSLSAFLLGGVFGIVAMIAGRVRRNTGIPFGPWMLGGAWVGIVAGEPIARWYLALTGLE